MKCRFFLVAILLAVCLSTVGCDSGLEIVEANIDQYPDRIVYFAGIDDRLDLSGGQITLRLRDGEIKTLKMDDETVSVLQDIDFNTPGIYSVELSGPLYFPIQVIDRNYIDAHQK